MILRTVTLLLPLLCSGAVFAQSPVTPHRGDRSIGAWVGFSPISRVGDFVTRRRELLLIGARAEWVIETVGPFALAVTSDLVPMAVVTHTPTYITREVVDPDGTVFQFKEETGDKPVFGAGAAPFGFKLYLGSSRSARLYAASAIGGLWFTRDMPVPEARRFNVSLEFGGGLELVNRSGRSVLVGYKFHHLSNANSAAFNPSLDSHVLYLGLSRAR